MLTKNIKYPYVKFFFDALGVLTFLGALIIIGLGFYANFESGGSSEFGFEVSGNSMILLNALILTILLNALISFICQKIK